ncbi:MAG TPA: CotH kinase family protein, partial [Anaerolineae bacterium]|nr:CotH kinase family protein [Anaerolineae bacterium]
MPPHREVAGPRCGTASAGGLCLMYLPLVQRMIQPQIDAPIGFNSGGEELLLSDGRRFMPDQELTALNGAGYVQGTAVASDFVWEPIQNTEDDALYRTARSGLTDYRFDVPNGRYIVEMHMAEIRQHGPGFRVFDVAIEGQQALGALDLYALAQHDYAVVVRRAADVDDGQLSVSFSAIAGQPLLAAIWVDRHVTDSQPPAAPAAIQVVGGYRRALVRWPQVEEADVTGYRVYRAPAETGPFQPVTEQTTPLARFFDDSVAAGQRVCYAASAIDVDGNESPRSPAACATVVDDSASSLPLLRLAIAEDNLRALAANPFAEIEVPGVLTFDGQRFDIIAEYRGATTQGSNKKSWKLEANRSIPYWQADTLLLNGEGYDPAMIREKIAYDLFAEVGIEPPQAGFVRLSLNNEFIGVFTRVENPDREFLQRTGRNPADDVFRCRDGLDIRPDCINQILASRSTAELYAFAALVNRTPDDEFASAIADVLDVPGLLDYQAIKALIADQDSTYQFLLHRSQSTGRWQVLPWDNNLSFNDARQPVNYGTTANPGYDNQVNVLLSRVLEVPQYRHYYGKRLLELAAGLFSLETMRSRLDAAKDQIWFDAERDVWKVHREDNEAFTTSLSHVPDFVMRRLDYVTSTVPAFVPSQSRFIAINELMPINANAIIDPADGQADPWFELVNVGLEPVDMGGMYLTNQGSDPTRYRIPDGTSLPPLGALLFWADNQPSQGTNHVNFTLAADEGQVHLFDRDGTTAVSTVAYPALVPDVAWGRFPDYNGQWLQFRQPTPGQPNRLPPPAIENVAITPRYPQAGDAVTVTATIADDGSVLSANLFFGAGAPTFPVPMFDDGNHGDGAPGDGLYGAQIPGRPHGTVIDYYISAADDYGRTAFDPAAAPVLSHRYRVGLQPGPVVIKEFMAANQSTIEDPDEPGEYPDWIELFNNTEEPVNLNGYYLTDNLQRPTEFRIGADVVVAPGGAVLFWADDDIQQGPLHTNFKLDKDGEAVGLFDRDGSTPLDTVVFPLQSDDVSYGRCSPNSASWEYFYLPTPGEPNACGRLYL